MNPLGIVVGLSGGWAFAAYSLFGKAAHRRGISPWTATFGAFTMATAFLLLLQPRATLFWLGPQVSGWVLLTTLALVPTSGGYGLYTVSLAYLPAAVANIIVTLEPVMTGIIMNACQFSAFRVYYRHLLCHPGISKGTGNDPLVSPPHLIGRSGRRLAPADRWAHVRGRW